MFDIKNILEPVTLSDAVKMYGSNPNLKIIAGGSDMLIRLRHGKLSDVELISLRNIKSLETIKQLEDGSILIGAMVTFSNIFKNEIIKCHLPILAEAAVSMGGPQIRNSATIGGNICNGAVSADSAPSLFSLNAILKLESPSGTRMVPIRDFYDGPGKVKLHQAEILSSILITKENYHEMSGKYIKFSNRKAMDIAMLSVAVVCKIKEDKFSDLRIALGVSAPIPIRCEDAEQYGIGKSVSNETINEIGRFALKTAKPRDSWRGSKAYREHLIQVLTQRAIKQAIERVEENYFE